MDTPADPPVALVRHLMTAEVVTLNVDDDLDLSALTMASARIRHLPVVHRGKLVGLVTHRDLLRAGVSMGLKDTQHAHVRRQIAVGQIMTTDLVTVGPDTKAAAAGRLLLQRRIGCVLVVDRDDRLVGILTESDFLDFAVRALESLG